MKWPRTTAVMAAALLSLAGCSNPVERGAPSSGDENPRGNTGDTPSSGESAEPGTPNGGSGDRFADYLPELGPSPTWHEGADFFDPCEDVPHHIYEQAGFSNPTTADTFTEGHFPCELLSSELSRGVSPAPIISIDTLDISPREYQSMPGTKFHLTDLDIDPLPKATAVIEEATQVTSCKVGIETVGGNVYFTYFHVASTPRELCAKAVDLFIELMK